MDKNIVTEIDDKSNDELPDTVRPEDPEAYHELVEDLAIAERALEEYDAQGIEGTTSYNEYRAKRLGTTA